MVLGKVYGGRPMLNRKAGVRNDLAEVQLTLRNVESRGSGIGSGMGGNL